MKQRVHTPIQRRIATWIPYVWLLAFFLAPFAIVLKISLSEVALSVPPYAPVFESLADIPEKIGALSFDNYLWLKEDALYVKAYLSSLRIAFVSTVLALLIGYPIAYGMARAPRSARPILLMMVILPFWTSFLIRVYAWIGILKPEGILNNALGWTGLFDADGLVNGALIALGMEPILLPLTIINTNKAVYIGIVYSYLPFMVLPLYASLERIDHTLLEAAADLGSTPLKSFWQITFPLSLPGIFAGTLLVFIPAVGEFVIPDLLGGSETLMIGRTLWNEFFFNRDWPLASAVAIVLLLLLVVPIVIFQNAQARVRENN